MSTPAAEPKKADPTDVLVEFLKSAVQAGGAFEKPEYHAVFAEGTVVRFELSAKTFGGFKDADVYDFPVDRLCDSDDLAGILDVNETAFKAVLDGKDTERDGLSADDYTRAVHTAYRLFVEDGYPYPGGEGADRTALPLEGGPNRAMVFFPARRPMVFNIIAPSHFRTTADAGQFSHTFAAGDFRRDDFMDPRLVALITPTLQLHRL